MSIEARRVHFVGIGGIGMSALARMMLAEGKTVSGSDCERTPLTQALATLGVDIKIGQEAENVPAGVDLVVYTIAAPADNPEVKEARRRDLKLLSYPEALGMVSAGKDTIAVSGTHGKTTTTAMLAKIMFDAGLEPTVIVGSLIDDPAGGPRTNFIAGRSRWFLVEACEYRRSFLHLSPKILVITNIDNDHLDYYRDIADIQSAFAELAVKVPAEGALICAAADPRLQPVLLNTQCLTVDYRQGQANFRLRVPGEHNQLNAQAALAAAGALKISPPTALGALQSFRGSWRRFEFKGKTKKGAPVYDDYAHHPAEIRAALAAAREVSRGKIFLAFQPHLYSRTKLLFDDFVKSLALADELALLPIYAAREPKDPSVSSQTLARAIRSAGRPARAPAGFAEARDYLTAAAGPNDLVLVMGAGDIYRLAESLV